ncbi:MAG: alpha/beta hydrolase-fold protein [Planctomycetota bacterium]|nr:alpha/beta hydrolase-fold protein [Planctomycetota bacterium]
MERNVCAPRVGALPGLAILCLGLLAARGALAEDQQPTGLQARHAAGQTILTWKEAAPPVTDDAVTVDQLNKARADGDKQKKTRYRIYRSLQPLASVKGLQPVAEVPPLTCWNTDFYGGTGKPDSKALRYVVEEGKGPVPPGTGICAYNPPEPGEAYYAVTVSVGGQENEAVTEANSLKAPVKETVGQGVPVLQRIEKPKSFNYVDGPTLHYYVRWEAPPNCSVIGKPFDYLVAVPPAPAKPAPVGIHLHCWGGSLESGYGWWYNAEKGALLIASNQIPYDWWTGYHEFLWTGKPLQTKEDFRKGVVRAFSQTRLLSFLDWVATKWDVDPARTFVAGSSMGGAGAPMFAIRYSDRIAWAVGWVGVHIPAKSPTFKGSYEQVFGKPEYGVEFEDGSAVWDYFNDVWYLRKYPQKEIGFITFSNGKNDGAIGWPQAVEFLKALQETKRPHLFVWGMSGHGQRATMPADGGERINPMDIRTDRSLPAFTKCSLDNNPGNGDAADGEKEGQVNRFLYWESADAVDKDTEWAMTMGLVKQAPKGECTVDVTPRRCQKFKVKPGEKLKWTCAGKEAQSGEATADQWGLVTVPSVRVTKEKCRLTISRP